jgi:TPR repeat protein
MDTDAEVFMFYMIACRKPCDSPIENDLIMNPDTLAKMRLHLAYIPEEPIEALELKCAHSDTNAMLSLGDCHLFGLKDLKKNMAKAREMYERAADLNNYEAVSQLAVMAKHDTRVRYDLVNQYLGRAADAGYIPQLLVYFVEEEIKRGRMHNVSDKVLAAYNERCRKFNLENFENVQPRGDIPCDNQGCETRASNESIFFRCYNCQTAKYCSKVCQTADWSRRHRKECSNLRAAHLNGKYSGG